MFSSWRKKSSDPLISIRKGITDKMHTLPKAHSDRPFNSEKKYNHRSLPADLVCSLSDAIVVTSAIIGGRSVLSIKRASFKRTSHSRVR